MNVRRVGTIIILAQGAVALLHEFSHHGLHVILPPLMYALAYLFVGILPLVALALLWTRRLRLALWILLVSMGGSLLYAGALHFVLDTPDHVKNIAHGDWNPVFQWTAVGMAIFEAYACWFALRALRQSTE